MSKIQSVAEANLERLYRAVFQTSIDFISVTRADDDRYIDVNQAFLDALGFEREEVIGHTSLKLNIWADPRDRQNLVQMMSPNSACRNFETRFRKKNGDMIWIQLSSTAVEIEGVPCLLSVMRDVSSSRTAAEKSDDLALYDPLTRLPNRRLLLDRLQHAMAACVRNPRKQALLFVDLDHFRELKIAFGRETGDGLLQEIAQRLSGCLRASDTVARLEGDVFVVTLKDLSIIPEDAAAQAETVAKKIFTAVGRPHLVDGHDCYCPCSIGIAVFGAQSESAQQVLQQAELALQQARTGGNSSIRFFAPALQAAVNSRAAMEEDLRKAIKNRQFVLYYQPQVDSTALVGVEALLRWNHPTRGLLAPCEFIPLAEETGLILPLGYWALETACKQIAAWAKRKAKSSIMVTVNISARQFREPDFAEQVIAILARTGANAGYLKLELTENMLVEDPEGVIAKMTELSKHGLHFSLDDFGTGYASLAQLKRMPFDQLKIDRGFVRDILVDSSSSAIAQTTLSLGRAMGLSVIAEGVETEEQRDFLSRLGCQAFQGFLYSRPLPLEKLERLWPHSAQAAAQPVGGMFPVASAKKPVQPADSGLAAFSDSKIGLLRFSRRPVAS